MVNFSYLSSQPNPQPFIRLAHTPSNSTSIRFSCAPPSFPGFPLPLFHSYSREFLLSSFLSLTRPNHHFSSQSKPSIYAFDYFCKHSFVYSIPMLSNLVTLHVHLKIFVSMTVIFISSFSISYSTLTHTHTTLLASR